MIVSCKNCHKEFEKEIGPKKINENHYCSRSCSAKTNNLGKTRNKPIPRNCQKCKKEYFRNKLHQSTSLCEICSSIHKNQTELHKEYTLDHYRSLNSVTGKHPSWVHAHVRQFARTWNKDMAAMPCMKCGYSIHVELCHIKAIASFDGSAKLGEVNSSNNIIPLCRNHHWEFDNGVITLSDILKSS